MHIWNSKKIYFPILLLSILHNVDKRKLQNIKYHLYYRISFLAFCDSNHRWSSSCQRSLLLKLSLIFRIEATLESLVCLSNWYLYCLSFHVERHVFLAHLFREMNFKCYLCSFVKVSLQQLMCMFTECWVPRFHVTGDEESPRRSIEERCRWALRMHGKRVGNIPTVN